MRKQETKKQRDKIEKVYGYRRCLWCKETIFGGYAYRRKYGKRKRYFCSKNCLIVYILDQINIEMDLKSDIAWTLGFSIKDYWDRSKIKESIDKRIERNYEKVYVKTK